MFEHLQKELNITDKNRGQIFIFSGLIAIIIVILYLNFICIPQLSNFFSIVRERSALSAELRKTRIAVSEIDKLKKELGASRAKVSECEKMLPAQQEIPSLLENLSAMAKDSNVKIVGITPMTSNEDKSVKDRTYQEIPILINARSGYHELGKFIDNLENAVRFMKIADIWIKTNKAAPKENDIELLVITYTLLTNK